MDLSYNKAEIELSIIADVAKNAVFNELRNVNISYTKLRDFFDVTNKNQTSVASVSNAENLVYIAKR